MKKVLFWVGAVVAGLIVIGALSEPPAAIVSPATIEKSLQVELVPTVEVKQETTEETVPFTAKTFNDSSMASGQSKLTKQGVNGKITHYFDITYTDGKETARTETKTLKIDPVNQITAVGTSVAPAAPQHPAGASAICADGTYSYSQNRRGTCSWHGGVAQWLY